MAHAFLTVPAVADVLQRCTKIPWPNRHVANRVRGKMRPPAGCTAVGDGVLHVYKCRICEAWHVGHL